MNANQLFLLATTLFMGLALWLTPRLSRRGIFFGYTVDPAFPTSAAGRRITRRYALFIGPATALALLIGAIEPKLGALGFLLMLLAQLTGLWWAREEVRPHHVAASPVRSAALTTRSTRLPGGWLVWILPAVLPLVSLYLLHDRLPSLPDRIPIHWGIDGQPDRWTPKSFRSVAALPVLGLLLTAALVLMGTALARARQVSPAGDSAAHESRRRYFSLRTLLIVLYFVNTLFFLLTLQLLGLTGGLPIRFMLIGLTLGLFVLIGFSWHYAQRRPDDEPPTDGTRDECWYLGILYANPADPAIMVEQRLGFGYTLNLARPAAWLILACALAPAFLAPWLR